MPNNWFATNSGKKFSLLEVSQKNIDILDIGHSLGMLCRFNGHCDQFYSVAQHSVFVSHIIEPEFAFEGLMHDAAEAYLGDMIRPLKQIVRGEYMALETVVMREICKKFGLLQESPGHTEIHRAIKHVDRLALEMERLALVPNPEGHEWSQTAGISQEEWIHLRRASGSPHVKCWDPYKANLEFMKRFYFLKEAL